MELGGSESIELSTFAVYGAVELFFGIVILCLVLIWHSRGIRNLSQALEDKVKELKEALKGAKKETQEARQQADEAPKYSDYIDQQLEETRLYHQRQGPDKDIALDLDLQSPIERQVAALRHAFLVAEKEAQLSGNESHSNWEVLLTKLQQLIAFYEHAPSANQAVAAPTPIAAEALDNDLIVNIDVLQEELDNALRRIRNLECFKKMFFDMDQQWRKAKSKADYYYEKLQKLSEESDNEELANTINEYHTLFAPVDDLINQGVAEAISPTSDNQDGGNQESNQLLADVEGQLNKRDPKQSAAEIERLKQVNEDQRSTIEDLKQKLLGAETKEEQQQIIADVQEQMDQYQKIIRESETCIQMLESELNQTHNELEQHNDTILQLKSDLLRIPQLEKLVKDFSQESSDMLATIAKLERESSQLQSSLKKAKAETKSSAGGGDKIKLLQQQLNKLQTDHTDLEERYISLLNQN